MFFEAFGSPLATPSTLASEEFNCQVRNLLKKLGRKSAIKLAYSTSGRYARNCKCQFKSKHSAVSALWLHLQRRQKKSIAYSICSQLTSMAAHLASCASESASVALSAVDGVELLTTLDLESITESLLGSVRRSLGSKAL